MCVWNRRKEWVAPSFNFGKTRDANPQDFAREAHPSYGLAWRGERERGAMPPLLIKTLMRGANYLPYVRWGTSCTYLKGLIICKLYLILLKKIRLKR